MNNVHEQCPKSDSVTVLSQKLAKCTMCTVTAQPARPALLRPCAPPTCLRAVPHAPARAPVRPAPPREPVPRAPARARAARPAFPPLACHNTISLGSSPIQFCTKFFFRFFFVFFYFFFFYFQLLENTKKNKKIYPSVAFLATSTCSSLNTASIQLNNFMSLTLKIIKILFHHLITQIKFIQFYFIYFLCSSLLTVNS